MGVRLWWQYAGNVILSDIRENRKRKSWKYIFERRKDRLKYISLFKRTKKTKWQKPLSKEEQNELSELEKKLSFEDIIFFRSLADAELKKESENQKELEKYQKETKKGWFSGWFGSKEEEEQKPIIQLSKEEREVLYSTIDYDESKQLTEWPKEVLSLLHKIKILF